MGDETAFKSVMRNAAPGADGDEVDLSNFDFSESRTGLKISFSKRVNFDGCVFDAWPFGECQFHAGLSAKGVTFRKRPVVQVAHTGRQLLDFSASTFEAGAYFQTGAHDINLSACKINHDLVFAGLFGGVKCEDATEVRGIVIANGNTFDGFVSFKGLMVRPEESELASFAPQFSLTGCTFSRPVDLSCMHIAGGTRFDGTTFRSQVTFENTVFEEAPSFHDVKLHPETRFGPAEKFDKQFQDTKSAHAEARYRVLKELLAKQQALGEQLGFARLEMKAHTQRLGWLSLHHAYAMAADYGLSWARPALLLILLTGFFWIAFGVVVSPAMSMWDGALVILSVSNAFPFVGALKSLGLAKLPDNLPEISQLILAGLVVMQNVLSAILLFLIGLGVRNRLRMK